MHTQLQNRPIPAPWPPPSLTETPRRNLAGTTTVALSSVWVSVVAISVFSPDLVSGSEQQHLPVAAFGTWLWGVAATFAVLVAMVRLGASGRRGTYAVVAGITAALWLAAIPVGVFTPSMRTGSDPTTIPIGAVLAPIAAAAGAWFAAVATIVVDSARPRTE